MTKKLMQHQVRWSEFLSQFNLKIWFRPRWLGAKPDALTCQWDVYRDRRMECNVQPIFSSKQVDDPEFPVRTGTLEEPDTEAMGIMDTNQLMKNLKGAMEFDPLTINILQKLDSTTQPEGWELVDGTLQFWDWLYVLDQGNLRLQAIHNHHDHSSTGHFGEARTLVLVCWGFHWLGLQKTLTDYIKSCTSCVQAKAPHHKLYGKLKQLPIPSRPW